MKTIQVFIRPLGEDSCELVQRADDGAWILYSEQGYLNIIGEPKHHTDGLIEITVEVAEERS